MPALPDLNTALSLLPRASRGSSSSSSRGKSRTKIRGGKLAGIVVAAIIGIIILLLIAFLIFRMRARKRKSAALQHEQQHKMVGNGSVSTDGRASYVNEQQDRGLGYSHQQSAAGYGGGVAPGAPPPVAMQNGRY